MYQGGLPWGCSAPHPSPASSPCVLDPARENYFEHDAGDGVVDLAKSVFLDPKPANAVLPPGW